MAIPQTFNISLNSIVYNVRLEWNNPASCWIMDFADSNNNPIVQGTPLITGAMLFAQYKYLGLSGDFFVQSSADPDSVPTFSSLGTTSNLYFIPALP